MGNTVVNNNGLTIAGGPSITTAGVDAGGKKIINVAAGDISSTSTDAVNGSQLNDTNNSIANVMNEVNNFAGDQSATNTTINGRGIRYVRTNDTGLTVDDAYAQGVGSTAVGYQAKSTGANALALGRNAVASADNSVALGANATTLADLTKSGYNPSTTASIAGTAPVGEVSVGSAGAERRVRAGLNKHQISDLIGFPHFSEGIAGVREWNYVFNFIEPIENGDVVTCQFKVLFDENKLARSFYWLRELE